MVKKEVSFVLRLIDDFNGRDIFGPVQGFYIRNFNLKPIVKQEGYYVFINCDVTDDVIIESLYYNTKSVPVSVIEKYGNEKTVTVRLHRKQTGIFNDCSWQNGKQKANYLVLAIGNEVNGLSLSKVDKNENNTVVYFSGYSSEKLTGMCYCTDKGKKANPFYIIGKTPDGGYEISHGKNWSHQKGQKLYRLYSGYSDKEGCYSIPIEVESETETISTKIPDEWGCYHN